MTSLALALLLVSVSPEWCRRASERVSAEAGAAELGMRIEGLLAEWPPAAGAVAERVRTLGAAAVPDDVRLAVLRVAVRDACRADESGGSQALAARAAALMHGDARFGGVREGDDLLDRVLHKVWLAVARLLESEGMRQYAGSARIVYFVLLLAGLLLLGWHLARALSRSQTTPGSSSVGQQERARRQEFASWRARAAVALDAGDPRGALRAGQAALLARIGELQEGAVAPASTHREIVARLHGATAAIVVGPLQMFDVAWFGQEATLDAARRFLVEVDAAEEQLPRAATRAHAEGAAAHAVAFARASRGSPPGGA